MFLVPHMFRNSQLNESEAKFKIHNLTVLSVTGGNF